MVVPSDSGTVALFDLPPDVTIKVVHQFLPLSAVARLDSATCNSTLRPILLLTLTMTSRVIIDQLPPLSNPEHYMLWLNRRGIMMRALTIPKFKTPAHFPLKYTYYASHPLSILHLKSLHTLHLQDVDVTNVAWLQTWLQCCPNLKKLKVRSGKADYLSYIVIAIYSDLKALEMLTLINTGRKQAMIDMHMLMDDQSSLRQVYMYQCYPDWKSQKILSNTKISFTIVPGFVNKYGLP